ncbi:MAG TPA: VOC family protein [Candidatus Binataceae bacterium]|nr:VOC family protein [Candidatus Binataceae bacterium]
MFKIGRLFHLTHVVSDLRKVDQWYDEVFGVTRYYHGYAPAAGRDASLIAIGNLIMEPMAPARVAKLRNPSVKKFHERFGQHFHSIAWYVDDVGAISTHLGAHGLRLFDINGTLVTPPNEKFAVWTHPRETHGQLEFAAVGSKHHRPVAAARLVERLLARAPSARNRVRVAHHCGGGDVAAARRLYCEVLGGRLLHERETPARKRSAFVAVGEDTVVELAQPLGSDGREALDLERNGEGIHALTLRVRDLRKVDNFLRSRGLRPESDAFDSIVLGPDQAFGMVIGFTERAVPNDPRAE